MDNDQTPLFYGKVGTILIIMGSASFVVTIFHLIILCRTHHHVTNQTSQQEEAESEPRPHQIPAHKYQKKKAETEEDDTCAVCLGDFEEGEDLKTLPECMHSFHVPCIDTWLYSHSNCPVCRACATPSLAVDHRPPEIGSLAVNSHHRIDILQNGFAR